MPKLNHIALPAHFAVHYQKGGMDENDQTPEQHISDGSGIPCRHCLSDISTGESCLLVGYRPFDKLNPYAELGPIFIHTNHCKRFPQRTEAVPEIITQRKQVLIRGYDADDRIVEGTGQVIKSVQFKEKAEQVLSQCGVDYLHVRSVTNNCFFCRVVFEQSTLSA